MKKRIAWLLALCLLLSGCAAAKAPAPSNPASSLPAPTTGTPGNVAAQPIQPPAPAAAPQVKGSAGGTGTYRIASAGVDPASQAYYDGLPRESEAFVAFDAVMNGNRKFTNAQTGNSMSIFSVFEHYATNEVPNLRQLTVVDLNQDSVLELILWMQTASVERFGFVLLSYYGGEVYGKLIDHHHFVDLKTDGSFILTRDDGSQAYARFSDPSGLNPAVTYADQAANHDAKTDVIWFDEWLDLIYPGASSHYGGPVGVLAPSSQLIDPVQQTQISLTDIGQLLMPQGVRTRIVQCAAIDLDWDGTQETIFQIGTDTDDDVGFVILRQNNEQYIGQGYYYRTFYELRTDGSYHFSTGAKDSGYGMLSFQNGVWMETVLAQTYENVQPDGNAYQLYFVGGQMTTQEAYENFVARQEAKPLLTWYPDLAALNAAP